MTDEPDEGEDAEVISFEDYLRDRIAKEILGDPHPMFDRCLLCGDKVRWGRELMEHTCDPNRPEPKLTGILSTPMFTAELRDPAPANYLTREILEATRDRVFRSDQPVAVHPSYIDVLIPVPETATVPSLDQRIVWIGENLDMGLVVPDEVARDAERFGLSLGRGTHEQFFVRNRVSVTRAMHLSDLRVMERLAREDDAWRNGDGTGPASS